MTVKALLAATAFTLGAATAASATTLTVDFPSASSSQTTTTGGTFFFTAGDFSEETFLDTGIADLTAIDFAINLTDNVLNSGAFVNFNVLINSLVVGAFTISDGDGEGQFDYSFAVADADPLGDDYTVRFEMTNTVPGGDGSIAFDRANSSATLTGSPVAAVPLPASIPLLLAGLGALGVAGRRKKAA